MIDFTRLFVTFGVVVLCAICCEGFNAELSLGTRETANVPARCRFRFSGLFPPNDVWKFLTGFWCFAFTNPVRFTTRNFTQVNAVLDGYTIPLIRHNDNIIVFDFNDTTSRNLIRPLFRREVFFNLWRGCSELAVECCNHYLNETNVLEDDEHICPALWDGWDCWPPARANQTLRRTCPPHAFSTEDIVCQLESERYCLEDGWNHQTNYSGCAAAPILRRRHQYHVLVLTISAALTFPAVLIFFIFMRGQTDMRHILYRNLLIAIVLKNIFTAVAKEVIVLDALRSTNDTNRVMENNGVGCRVLSFFDSLFTVSVFTGMLLVGFYLHSTIARVFGKRLSVTVMYAVGAACTLIPTLIWAIAVAAYGMEYCWANDQVGFHWITDVYKFCTLIINLVLLLDIVRVICCQRSSSNLNSRQTRAAAKAILVLIPLFGLPILLTSQRDLFDQDSCLAGDIYYFTAYTIEALQGIIVALLFCYLNKEVHREIRNKYRKLIIWLNDRFGTNFTIPSKARVTTMTNVRSSGLDIPQHRQQNGYGKKGLPEDRGLPEKRKEAF
ncbi:hypothetical protein Trydic_g8470 [Trypoxylus dichotomus]